MAKLVNGRNMVMMTESGDGAEGAGWDPLDVGRGVLDQCARSA